MSLKNKSDAMKINRALYLIVFLILICVFISACKKEEDTEAERKEALTNKFNSEISADSLESVVTWLQEMGTRFALAENRRNVAMSIKKRFERLGYSNARLDSFPINKIYRNVSYYQHWQYNVIASIPGSLYPDSICLIGGHYDNILNAGDPFTIVPGANDNASGVAAAIEIARVMKTNNYTPVNTIEFVAFGAEELGLFGSYAYANNARINSKKIKLMLNNDMIAFQPSVNKAEWRVNIIDYDNSHNLRKEAEVITGRFTNLKTFNNNTYYKQSDSYPFFVNGFKALFFIAASSDPYYHTLDDKADKSNFEFCREIVKLNCAILIDKN
jgi:hypothetical protein